MRFLVDECTGPAVARWLRKHQHEVFSIYDEARGMHDDDIIQKAYVENWILITNDKDFGEKWTKKADRTEASYFSDSRMNEPRTRLKLCADSLLRILRSCPIAS